MLTLWECAAHMGRFLGSIFAKQGSFSRTFSETYVSLAENSPKIVKNG